jgi:hypothetical protein
MDNWSPVTLQRRRKNDDSQRWRLRPTDDGGAFLIENIANQKALDASDKPQNLVEPHVWDPHWESWQQWVIARLPLVEARSS